MSLTDPLARSFFDLWHHLDPVGAGRLDPLAPPPTLVDYDPDTLGQHHAALRSLLGAAEALEPDSLDDEIDLTILLDALRGLEHQLDQEAPRFADPALWADRLAETLTARVGEAEVLEAIPAWASAAAEGLGRPPVFGLATGLAILEATLGELAGERWATAGADRLARARAEIEGLIRALQAESRPVTDASQVGIGEAAVDHRLHFDFQVTPGGGAELRSLAALAESLWAEVEAAGGADLDPSPAGFDGVLEAWPAHRALVSADAVVQTARAGALGGGALRVSAGRIDGEVLAARYGPRGAAGLLLGRASAASEIRRRFLAPATLEGWALFAEARAAARASGSARARLLADLHRRVVLGAVDLAIHRRQLPPLDAVTRLGDRTRWSEADRLAAVRGILLAPMDACGSVVLWREWERLAADFEGGADALVERVFATGLAKPVLIRWRHGAAE
ncbi:MAG: hypothetical protein AB7R55_21885 [Gemmatimonadales bacterium]